MKRILLVMTVAGFALIIGVLVMVNVINKKCDVAIPSVDGEAELVFEKTGAKKSIGQTTYQVHSFTVAEAVSLWKDVIKDHRGYLYSLDPNNRKSNEETGEYLLCQEGHYFLLSVKNTDAKVTELVFETSVSEPEYYFGFVLLPFAGITGISTDNNCFKWSDTVGLTCFDDLVEFYGRVDKKLYQIDYVDKEISLFPGDPQVKTPLVVLTVKDDELVLEFTTKLTLEK